jgi:galactose-1-phosphate uridylyltransferase
LEPPSPEELETCPFCAGHEELTPPQTLVLPEQGEWARTRRAQPLPRARAAGGRRAQPATRALARRAPRATNRSSSPRPGSGGRPRCRGYVHALVNEGREAGSSLPHSHSQLVWLPEPPPAHARPRLERFAAGDGLVAGCPWASRLPYETVIAPAEHDSAGFESELLAPALRLLGRRRPTAARREGPVPLNAVARARRA